MLGDDYVPVLQNYLIYSWFALFIYGSVGVYALVMIIITFLSLCKRRAPSFWIRMFSFLLILCFSALRVADNLLHVGGWYEDYTPNVWKHLLFVLPICFLFTAYLLTVATWENIVIRFYGGNTAKRQFFLMVVVQIIFNVVLYTVMTVFTIITRPTDSSIRMIGWNNVALCILYVLAIVYFLFVAIRFLALLIRHQRSFSEATGKYAGTVMKITLLAVVATLAFGWFTGMFVYEGWFMVRWGGFILYFKGFTTTHIALWNHCFATVIPPYALLACYVDCSCCFRKRKHRGPLTEGLVTYSNRGNSPQPPAYSAHNDDDDDDDGAV
ncbi:hypothetical protein PAPYR_6298 [Paratrimastix pyriformis]|uniref:THH1/TOM1/TOM3 domain-containing protein n=1 Tax=Paratrimastix pyriformis TaxID=342808 RepID=A0ABQ8UFI0_9EUKA|nr:hypothetical protein PAPYR_6298 [Paratrimastix pyriformis]